MREFPSESFGYVNEPTTGFKETKSATMNIFSNFLFFFLNHL